MTKKRTGTHEIEQFSRGMFLARFSDCVVNSFDEADYAFDFEVRPTGKVIDPTEVYQSPFFVQLKSTEKFDDREEVWWDFETSYLTEDCLSASVPVILCIYERLIDQFSWCVLQPHCWDVLDEENPDWRSQANVRIRTERDSLQSQFGKKPLLEAVSAAQRRITMRASIASKRRNRFAHPPGTVLASTEEVRTHKRELVEDARRLAEAGHPARALDRFMQVFQLPEEDRPTLEAVCYLLKLRETTDPQIAFAKLRLANQGAVIARDSGETDILDLFEDTVEKSCNLIQEEFIGSRYKNLESGFECLVLEVVNRGRNPGREANWVATMQDAMGDIEMETAEALSGSESYELIESGAGTNPRDDACEEREHDFDAEDLREYPRSAICSHCGLTHGVISDWLGQDAPDICTSCSSTVWEFDHRREGPLCHECAGK